MSITLRMKRAWPPKFTKCTQHPHTTLTCLPPALTFPEHLQVCGTPGIPLTGFPAKPASRVLRAVPGARQFNLHHVTSQVWIFASHIWRHLRTFPWLQRHWFWSKSDVRKRCRRPVSPPRPWRRIQQEFKIDGMFFYIFSGLKRRLTANSSRDQPPGLPGF